MFALHWICALTLALVGCLCAQPVKRDAELLGYVSVMINYNLPAKCPNDTTLYSPFDIKKECIYSALNCSITELNVLKAECDFSEDDKDAIDNVILSIRKKQTTPSGSCRCEMYEEKDVKTFLDNMQRQMQQYNSFVTGP